MNFWKLERLTHDPATIAAFDLNGFCGRAHNRKSGGSQTVSHARFEGIDMGHHNKTYFLGKTMSLDYLDIVNCRAVDRRDPFMKYSTCSSIVIDLGSLARLECDVFAVSRNA